MDYNRSKKLILLCTGFGHIQRGFEMYISSIGEKLGNGPAFKCRVEVWAGGGAFIPGITVRRIPSLYRNGNVGKRLAHKAFLWEQRSFALGMLPQLLKNKNAVYYLGEYQLYCYLFKIRQWLGLDFSLVLYTGGQAIPGLFDASRDFIHHVTDRYLPECNHLPADRQLLLPHFIQEDFLYDTRRQQEMRQKAGDKKIVLSVGLVDRATKRMDLLVDALAPLNGEVFPVILGQYSSETAALQSQLEFHFGKKGFVLETIPHSQLGDWYRIADLFVLCSPKESFGLAMVEALYHDLPVICRDFREARFVMKDHAIYLPNEDAAVWSRAIREALQQEKQPGVGAKFTKEHYTWDALQPAYHAMFTGLMNEQDKFPASTGRGADVNTVKMG